MLLMLLLLGGYLFQIIFLSCYVGDQEGRQGGRGVLLNLQSGAFGGFVDLTYGSFRDLLTFVIC